MQKKKTGLIAFCIVDAILLLAALVAGIRYSGSVSSQGNSVVVENAVNPGNVADVGIEQGQENAEGNPQDVVGNQQIAEQVPEAGAGVDAEQIPENGADSGAGQSEENENGTIKAISFTQGGITVTDRHFFSETVQLAIDFPADAKVYYTTSGKEPKANSTEYKEPIVLETTNGSFPNCLILKARAYYADGTKSEVVTHTFWAQESIDTRFETIVFSVVGDQKHLTNQNTGIFVGDNAYQRGPESEREVHIEAINSDGSLIFAQGAGVRPYGGASRGSAIKSMKLFARREYDVNHGKFEIDAFGTTGADGEIMNKYDKLVLRNYGNDFQFAFIRDELNQRLTAQMGYTNGEAVIPAVVYLNGTYYGLFYLHESYCDDFFKDKFGGVTGHYEVLEGGETYKSADEDDEQNVEAKAEYKSLYNRLAYSDLTEEHNFAELCAFMDVENYLQYYAYNIYINNNDWPQNNYKCFRYYAGEGEGYGEGALDGRWRFLFHDMDFSMGLYNSDETIAGYNNLKLIMDEESDRYSPLFTNLMKREDCREYFVEEIKAIMNTVHTVENVGQVLDDMNNERATEMLYFFEHLEAMKETNDDIWIWYDEYLKRVDNIKKFATQRKAYMIEFLKEAFGLSQI